ncbi:MAG: hypothetical protein V1927_01350 [Candidatus Omnitrophota bacterium]
MKKITAWLLLFFMLASLTGCETVAKKFRRKKKEVAKMPRIFKAKAYVKKPTPELYKKHYAYWSSWHSELIQELGDNHKKDTLCIEQIVSNLKDMQNILTPDKGGELTFHIEKLAKVRNVIVNGEMSTANRTYILRTLEREESFIKREFAYTKAKFSLKKSFEEEAAAAVPPPKEDISGKEAVGEPESCVRLSH